MAHFQTPRQWGGQEPNEKNVMSIHHPSMVVDLWALVHFGHLLIIYHIQFFCFGCGLQFEMFQYGIQCVHPILTTLTINWYWDDIY
jgi:hypothetical protein